MKYVLNVLKKLSYREIGPRPVLAPRFFNRISDISENHTETIYPTVDAGVYPIYTEIHLESDGNHMISVCVE